jgi:prophage antirepressor-like protein
MTSMLYLDAYDEIAALLGIPPLAEDTKASDTTELADEPGDESASAADTPLVALFKAKDVRIQGTVNLPSFCACDVAKRIGDAGYRRILKDYGTTYVITIESKNTKGRRQRMLYLTERGLYRYLLQSRLDAAIAFQEFTYDLLTAERKRTVNSLHLALKIVRTQLDEQKNIAQHARTETEDVMRVANDAREKLRQTQDKLKRLQRAQQSSTQGRIATAEKANAERSWMSTFRPVY